MNTDKGINLGIALRRIFEIAEWLDLRAIVLDKSDAETLPKLRAELAQLKTRLAPAPEEPCKHETKNLMLLGSHWHWCNRCGSAQRLVDGKPFGSWKVPEETQDGAMMDEWYGGFSKIEKTN